MTRRTRSAALLSVLTLTGAAVFSLALAPAASADIPTPALGDLSAAPSAPKSGDTVRISGTGCFTVALPTDPPSGSSSSGSSSAASGATTTVAAADATPAASATPPPPAAPAQPAAASVAGTVAVTITGPNGFHSTDTATASDNGTWTADNGIQVTDGGTYTVNAACTLTDPDPVLGQSATFDYDSLTLTVAPPVQAVRPSIGCTGCDDVNPGGTVTLRGLGFPAGAVATVSLGRYPAQRSTITAGGVLDPVSFVIPAGETPGRLTGAVQATGAPLQAFSVLVTKADTPVGDVDGTVPGDTDGSDVDTDPVTTDVPVSGTGQVAATPTLPATGVDSTWPGIIGGLLVAAGAGLVWVGRRREETGATTA